MSRVMVVDDEVVLTIHLEERLSAMGYEVAGQAFSGEEAVEMAKNLRPDVILMDIVMPGELDGIAAAEIIKTALDIPVIFLTAYSECRLIERAKIAEPFGYIIKPFHERELKAVIEVALYKKKMERRIRNIEKRYRTLFEKTANPILVIDTEGNYIDSNKSALQFLECTYDELLTKNIRDFIPPANQEAMLKEHIPLWRKGGRVEEVKYYINRKIKLLDLVVTPLDWDKKRVAIGIGTDITERKRSERFIKNILESVGEGLSVIDRDHRIVMANKAFACLYNISVKDMLGKYCYEVCHAIDRPCYKTGYECPVKHTFETGKPYTVRHTIKDKEGNPIYVKVKSYPMKDESGNIFSVIQVTNDITEKKAHFPG